MYKSKWQKKQEAEVLKARIHGFACGVLLVLGLLYAVLFRWMV